MSDQEDSGNSPDTLAAERSGIECEGSFCSGALRFAINWENDENKAMERNQRTDGNYTLTITSHTKINAEPNL